MLEKGGRLLILIQNDILDHGPPGTADLLGKHETVVAFATNLTRTTERAAIVHPVTPHSESGGTFTNFQGRVQRFRKASPAKGDALTVMELLRRIAAGLGKDFGWTNLNHVWKDMSASVPDFAGMSPMTIGDLGMPIASARARSDVAAPAEREAR
jgi:predicted molibdopterin-dependent oxidoreductase YjgC